MQASRKQEFILLITCETGSCYGSADFFDRTGRIVPETRLPATTLLSNEFTCGYDIHRGGQVWIDENS